MILSLYSALVFLVAPLQFQDLKTVVLLDGKTVQASSQPKLDEKTNMIAFLDDKGVPRLLGRNMIDWRATARFLPKLAREIKPRALAKPNEQKRTSNNRRKVAITNDSLAGLSKDQGLANSWDGPITNTSNIIIKTIAEKDALDLSQHLEGDRLVLFHFYTETCGQCLKLNEELEAFVRTYPGKVALKKVIISSSRSATARRYNIQAMPYLRLLDHKGKLLRESIGEDVFVELDQRASFEKWPKL